MALPTLVSLSDALLPSSCRATMQTTAIRATSRAYSTRLAPRSSRRTRARNWVQSATRFIDWCSLACAAVPATYLVLMRIGSEGGDLNRTFDLEPEPIGEGSNGYSAVFRRRRSRGLVARGGRTCTRNFLA